MIDEIDAIGDSSEYVQHTYNLPITWNGRDVTTLPPSTNIQSKLFQFPSQPQSFAHAVEQIHIDEEPSEFVFAPCTYQLTFDYSLTPAQIELCKSFFRRVWDGAKKGVKKAIDAVKKAMKAIAKATKKAEKKVEDFVKDHKKEILIAGAVIAAACGAYALTGALAGGAAAAANSPPPRKKEDEEGDNTTATAAPPPLPDWVENMLKSAAPDFSPMTASEAEIENAKNQVHNAWETLNHLKDLTEADLAHLKKENSKFNPTETAIEIITNTVLNDAQRREFAKTSSPQQNWHNLIHTGHERINQAFSAVTDYKAASAAAAIQPPPQSPTFSFFDKIKLGFEIIGRGMMEPELLDTNTRLDAFLKNQAIKTPLGNSNQTISEFVKEVQFEIENKSHAWLETGLMDSNAASSQFSHVAQNLNPEYLNENFFIFKLDQPLPFGTAAHSQDHRSRYFKTEGMDQKGMQISYINGMLNAVNDFFGNAKYIQNSSPENLCIHGVYNHSNGIFDLLEVFTLNYKSLSPNTQSLLMQQWTDFHVQNLDRPDAKILHFCHSQGAIHTKNALMRLPEEIQKRVIVVAIAPALVVPRDLCYASFNYASKRDLVPRGELLAMYWRACHIGDVEREELLMNIIEAQKEIIWLESHDTATGFDHGFQSPTFYPTISGHFQDYCERKGEYK